MSTARSMARNTAAMMCSQVITWALTFILLIHLPRALGAAGYGQMQFSLAFMGMFAVFINFGTSRLITREVARDHARASAYLTNMVALKTIAGLIAYAALVATVLVLQRPPDVVRLVCIFGVSMCLGAINALLDSILQGFEQVHRLAWGDVMDKAIKTGLVLALLFKGQGVMAVAWAMVSIDVIHLLRNGYWTLRLARPSRHLLNLKFTRETLVLSLPFLLYALFAEVYDKIDITMLGMMTSDAVVGWYSAAYRLFNSLFFLPHTFYMVVFPVLSRLSKGDENAYHQAVHRGFSLLAAGTVAVTVCTLFLADSVVELLYTQEKFQGTAPALRILAVALAFQYLNTMVVMVLQTSDRQAQWAKAGAAAAVFNPIANYLLIPLYGHLGAALTTALTEALLGFVALRACPRGVFSRTDRNALLRACMAGCLLAAAMALGLRWGPIPALVLGIPLYIWAVLRLNLISRADVALLGDVLFSRFKGLRRKR